MARADLPISTAPAVAPAKMERKALGFLCWLSLARGASSFFCALAAAAAVVDIVGSCWESAGGTRHAQARRWPGGGRRFGGMCLIVKMTMFRNLLFDLLSFFSY